MTVVLFSGACSLVGNVDAQFRVELAVDDLLDRTDPILVLSGGAQGPDLWATQAANRLGLHFATVKPLWERHGKAAGPIRNEILVSIADELIACWDGKSRGTLHTIQLAVKKGIPIDYLRESPGNLSDP